MGIDIRDVLAKSGRFLLQHPVYIEAMRFPVIEKYFVLVMLEPNRGVI